MQDAFIAAFEATKAEVAAMPGGRQFDVSAPLTSPTLLWMVLSGARCATLSVAPQVDELAIFGKVQLFGRRTAKLAELFTTTRQFLALEGSKIDGIEDVVERFKKVDPPGTLPPDLERDSQA